MRILVFRENIPLQRMVDVRALRADLKAISCDASMGDVYRAWLKASSCCEAGWFGVAGFAFEERIHMLTSELKVYDDVRETI